MQRFVNSVLLENWNKEKVDYKNEDIRSKIVHCMVHVNSTEKMLNTAMTTRGGAVFVVR